MSLKISSKFGQFYENWLNPSSSSKKKMTREEMNKLVKENLKTIAEVGKTYQNQGMKFRFKADGHIEHDHSLRMTRIFRKGMMSLGLIKDTSDSIDNLYAFMKGAKDHYHHAPQNEKDEIKNLLEETKQGLEDLKKTYTSKEHQASLNTALEELVEMKRDVESNFDKKFNRSASGYCLKKVQNLYKQNERKGLTRTESEENICSLLKQSLDADYLEKLLKEDKAIEYKFNEFKDLLKGLNVKEKTQQALFSELMMRRSLVTNEDEAKKLKASVDSVLNELKEIFDLGLKLSEEEEATSNAILDSELFKNTANLEAQELEAEGQREISQALDQELANREYYLKWRCAGDLFAATTLAAAAWGMPVYSPVLLSFAKEFGGKGIDELTEILTGVESDKKYKMMEDLTKIKNQILSNPLQAVQTVRGVQRERQIDGEALLSQINTVMALISNSSNEGDPQEVIA